MTKNEHFQWLKKYYEDIETLAYVGMVFWFVPFVFAFTLFRNDIVCYFFVFMFFFNLISVMVFFDNDRLWRWIQ